MASVSRAGGEWEMSVASRLVAGDETALGEIYDQFAAFVFGLARRVTANPTIAEDVTQEVFVSLWERPQAFDPERGTLRAWLGVLTHRRAVDRVRRETAAQRNEAAHAAQPATAPPDISEAATSMIVAQHVREAVAALPTEQRIAVELAYFGGKTYTEVAKFLGIPEGTAKSRLRLAMKKLATALGPEEVTQWN